MTAAPDDARDDAPDDTGDDTGDGAAQAGGPAESAAAPARRLVPPQPPGWPVVAVALALALLGLALAAAALLVGGGDDAAQAAQARDRLRAEALQAARERTTALTSYDHRTLEEDFAAVLETATGAFEDEYARTTDELRATFLQTQAVATSTVLGAGIERFDERRVVVVVAVDQVIRTAGSAPRTERNRLRMVLVRPERTWLVEQVVRL